MGLEYSTSESILYILELAGAAWQILPGLGRVSAISLWEFPNCLSESCQQPDSTRVTVHPPSAPRDLQKHKNNLY
jgi:hypothetical protein